MIKLEVITTTDSEALTFEVGELLEKEKNIVKTTYTTCADEDALYFTAFIEYRVCYE